MKKILFMDLDGTLLDDKKQITRGNRLALERILSQGHDVVITTGRPLPSAVMQAHLLGLDQPGCFLIAYNGALIYDWAEKKEIFSQTIAREDAYAVFDMANAAGIHIQTFDDQDVLVEPGCVDEALERYCRGTLLHHRVIGNIRRDLDRDPVKCLAIDFEDHEKVEAIRQKILSDMADRLDAFFSNPYYLEIVPAGINKGQAVKMLCKLLNIPIENAVAVGDEANDIPMLQAAGTGVAMANGTDPAKAAADAVTVHDNNHDGIAEVIERYF